MNNIIQKNGEPKAVVFDDPCPDLRPFHIQKDRDRNARFSRRPADEIQTRFMFRMRAVGKIQTGRIHARLKHLFKDPDIRTPGPDRADDLRLRFLFKN